MFDFEKLEVYQICKQQNVEVLTYLKHVGKGIDDEFLKEKWRNATVDIVLNMVEGVGRIPKPDKKAFITVARGYVFECVALTNLIGELYPDQRDKMDEFYQKYESLSKMLLGMIRSFDN